MRSTALIVAAVAVLALGFVLVQGADDEGSVTSADTSAQQTAEPAAAATAASQATTTEATAPAPEPKPQTPTVEFADGEAKGGVKKLAFDKGDRVRFRVRSDVADEIHVHGFDEYADVEAGKSVTIAFEAEFDGAYEVEMHGSGTPVASLVIQP